MRPGTPTSSPGFLIAAVCGAQVLAQLGAFTFFALLPTFFREWGLSHSEAGILNGIIFGAYALAVPFIVPLTDRIDPRRIYICAVGLTTCSHLGMARTCAPQTAAIRKTGDEVSVPGRIAVFHAWIGKVRRARLSTRSRM